ncbi:hypothetical protein A1OE_871 [Candidatus Endolissoclinum faulkneri L2]|uniref:Uncharacterized protein n=1 Tax=Candidatus Endolissoclinum faulkneri L2 TaxID=1193729 RepID=K7YHK6_9PROT|nr:hypothetical protein A1OE_871 [Candidatus Endolissoclinum faulkneri L2]
MSDYYLKDTNNLLRFCGLYYQYIKPQHSMRKAFSYKKEII